MEAIKKRFFSSPFNSFITLLLVYCLYKVGAGVFNWAILNATWSGADKASCAIHSGACWPFVSAHIEQFLFGFYPEAGHWRVYAVFGLLLALLVIAKKINSLKFNLCFFLLYPPLCYFLLSGGVFHLPVIETTQWGGLFLTILLAAVGIIASFPIGILLALGRQSNMPIIKSMSIIFIEMVRGVPLISILFMASVMLPLFLPAGVDINKLLRAMIGVTLFQAAYLAEVIRGGLNALPKGQYEAAQALGLTYWQSMYLIILPQALKTVIPGIVNTFIALFKDTTLVLIIGLYDFLGIVQAATTSPEWLGMAIEGYFFCAVVYWIFCFAMSHYSQRLEKRLQYDASR